MRRRTAALALVVVPAAVACTGKPAEKVDTTTPPAAVAAPAVTNTKADEDSIRSLTKRWNDVVARHDTVGWGAMFADDGKSYAPNVPVASGPAGVTRSVGGFYRMGKDVKLTFATSDVSVGAAGDLAVERGTYQVSFTDAKGKAQTDHGNYVTAWKKVNGQWKALADINAPEVPAPGM
jgi:ketosteroid isomerase-like protein